MRTVARLAQFLAIGIALHAVVPPEPLALEASARPAARAIAARAELRVKVGVAFVGKDRAGALAAAKAGGPLDPAPIPDGVWWTPDALARAAGEPVARAALETPVGAASEPVASAWGYWVVRPLARTMGEETL